MTDPVEAAILRSIEVCPYKHSDCINQSLYPCIACQWGVLSLELRHTNKDSFIFGAQWQANRSPWISVEERLPEKDGTRVWVKSSCLNHQPLVYHHEKFYARLSDGAYDGSVTHWMYIPEV